MVLEVAILNIRAGESAAFENAFAHAQAIITKMEGYQRHELRHCIEHPDRYLLLVWWDTLESHTKGFRGSAAYQEWKQLLHHFYDPFPEVEHYTLVNLESGEQTR
jgi:heme-degrading monooxygenase HmoA